MYFMNSYFNRFVTSSSSFNLSWSESDTMNTRISTKSRNSSACSTFGVLNMSVRYKYLFHRSRTDAETKYVQLVRAIHLHLLTTYTYNSSCFVPWKTIAVGLYQYILMHTPTKYQSCLLGHLSNPLCSNSWQPWLRIPDENHLECSSHSLIDSSN